MKKAPERRTQVTSIDVARLANVSRSAVSRTFTPGASVSEETRRKVLEAAQKLGYRVNLLARGLNKNKSDLVGMIVSGLSTPYRAAQIEALARVLFQEGFRPVLFTVNEGTDIGQLLSILLTYQVSGVIITSEAPPVEICEECARIQVPLVLVHRADRLPYVDLVNGDNAKGGRLAAEALIEAGRTRLVAVRHQSISSSEVARIDAFTAHARRAGHSVTVIDVTPNGYEAGQAVAAKIAPLAGPDLGVFCPSDLMALGLLDRIRNKMGIPVPEKMALVGYDDIPQAGWDFAELTTIRQPADDFARITVDVLKERIEQPDMEPRSRLVDVALVRRSTI